MMPDYKELYLLHCANLNDCTTKEDVKQHNVAMKQLGKLFHQLEGELDKSFLLELLTTENDHTTEVGFEMLGGQAPRFRRQCQD